ncbi:hypothetical protein HK100_012667 [Physocladia obscura]|uniref:Uncharacterized protein n=1 Tax=Physocladia obscura TaxID=109957 RepID=A0AAD5XHN5_9FUNG|nr:hypothetical protein HK100_012667 [Physocladia obscura]
MPPATSKRKHEEAVEQFEIKIGLIKKEYVVNSILSADIVDNMWNDYRSLVMSNQTRGPVCRNALSFMLTVGSVYITPQAALDRFYSALRDIEDCGDSLTFSECIELVNVWHRANLLSNSIDHVIEAALSRPNTGLIEALGWKFANLSNSVCLIMLIQQWYSMYAIESKENRNEVKVIDNEILSEFISMLSKVQETEFALLIFQYQKIALEKADFRELELLFPPKKYEQDETYNPKCIPFKIYRELMELLTHPIKVQIAVNHEYGKTLKNTAKRDKNFEFAKIDFTKTRLSLRLGDPSNEEFDQLNVSSFSVALNLFKEAIRLYPPNMNLERTEYENCKFLSLSSVFNFMVIIAAKHNEVNTLDVLLNDMNTFNMDLSTGALCMICAMQIRTFAQTDPENKKILKNLRSLSNLDANIRIPLYESTLKALASCNKFGLIMYVFEIMEQAAYQGKTDDRLKISRRVYETMMISGIEFGRIKSIEILMTLYRAAGYEPDLGLMKILEPYNNSDSDKSAEEHVTFEIFPSPIL